MKMILIQPPQPLSLDDRLDVPYSLMCLASVLLEEGIDTEILDLASIEEEKWNELIKPADVYGLIIYTTSYYICKRIAKICKEKNPEAKVVVGGPHPTTLWKETLEEPEFDVVCIGEGENAILDIVRDVSKNKVGQVYQYPKEENLDKFPLPTLKLIDFSTYHRKLDGKQMMTVFANRGCPYDCSFCCKDMFGRKVRFKSVEYVMKEIEAAKKITDSIVFWDDIFGLNREWLADFCERIKELKVNFRCNGRAGFNTIKDLELLKEAGCKEICFGIESGSQKILDLMNKRVSVEQNKKVMEEAKKAGLIVKAYLMIGYPGETKETIKETKKFIEETDPDQYSLFTTCAFPGSELFRNPKKYGITKLSINWDDYYCLAGQGEGGTTFECSSYTTSELREWRKELKEYLASREYRGGNQDYEEKVTWR